MTLGRYKIGNFFWLCFLIFLALWPITFLIYTSKWDNLDCFLPYRYFNSFYLQNGVFPLWNPFQNFGYPVHSDVQSGLFSPIAFLLSYFGPYTSIHLSIELSIYYLIAGCGAYQLTRLWVNNTTAQFMVGIAYALSGYMIATSQIMVFIAGAALLPWQIYYLIHLLQNKTWQSALKFALVAAISITSASPAFTIVNSYVFLAILFIYPWYKKNYRSYKWKDLGVFALAFIVLILLIAPFLWGIIEFSPYNSRIGKLNYGPFLLDNSWHLKHLISFLYPQLSLSTADFFNTTTDITLRSTYIGIIPLVIALTSFKYFTQKKYALLILAVVVFLILSLGKNTTLYAWAYHLPGFGLFRHPSFFRVYFLIFLLLLAALSWEHSFHKGKLNLYYSLLVIGILSSGIFIVSIFNAYPQELLDIFTQWNKNKVPQNYSLRTYALQASLITLSISFTAIYLLKKNPPKLQKMLLALIVLDLVIIAQVFAPFTLHLHTQQKSFQNYFNEIPVTFNQNSAQQAYKCNIEAYQPSQEGLWRNTATFHKSLSFSGTNPTQFKRYRMIEDSIGMQLAQENTLFYEISSYQDKNTITQAKANVLWDGFFAVKKAQMFINPDTLQLSNPQIVFNGFEVTCINHSEQEDLLVLNQNYHHNWQAQFNGKPLNVFGINEAFMAVYIPPKTQGKIEFSFKSPITLKLFWLAAFGYLTLILSLLLFKQK